MVSVQLTFSFVSLSLFYTPLLTDQDHIVLCLSVCLSVHLQMLTLPVTAVLCKCTVFIFLGSNIHRWCNFLPWPCDPDWMTSLVTHTCMHTYHAQHITHTRTHTCQASVCTHTHAHCMHAHHCCSLYIELFTVASVASAYINIQDCDLDLPFMLALSQGQIIFSKNMNIIISCFPSEFLFLKISLLDLCLFKF